MAVALEFIDLIVPISKIREKYPGGWEACLRDHEHLTGGRVWYPEDPYTVCGGPEQRKAFKTASLIAINAPNIRKAYRAIDGKFKEKSIPLPKVKKPLKYLVETFKAKHQPIANSICSDAGIKLQNIDSHIMNAILMRLMDMGILGLRGEQRQKKPGSSLELGDEIHEPTAARSKPMLG